MVPDLESGHPLDYDMEGGPSPIHRPRENASPGTGEAPISSFSPLFIGPEKIQKWGLFSHVISDSNPKKYTKNGRKPFKTFHFPYGMATKWRHRVGFFEPFEPHFSPHHLINLSAGKQREKPSRAASLA
jgi:hypothetical protein